MDHLKISLKTESHNWIMKRCALELTKAFSNVNIDNPDCDIEYFLPYTCAKSSKAKIKVGFFTHLETGSSDFCKKKKRKFIEVVEYCDYHICMNSTTQKDLFKRKKNAHVIKPGSRFKKDLVFGVCGKVHTQSGRKGEAFVEQLMGEYKFLAWGKGWPCEIHSQKQSELENFYNKIDYLVVTSTCEGGPVPVVEALSMGVPVIAPDVGWCWEYPVVKYKKGDVRDLRQVLFDLSNVPTWETWVKGHEDFFNSITV